MIVICGASENHYTSLIQLLNSINTQFISKIVIYNLGISVVNWTILRENFSMKKKMVYETFDYSKYPSFVNIEINSGHYAWKPLLIRETVEKWGEDIYVWMDAGNLTSEKTCWHDLDYFIHAYGIYTPTSDGNIEKWTHPKTIEWMGLSCIGSLNNRNGAIFGFYYKDWVKEFIQEWSSYSVIQECIAPEGSSRENHRQDQSILTLLYYKYQEKIGFPIEDGYFGIDIHKDMRERKKVIQVWTHNVKNLSKDTNDNFWGLGDIVRGTIHLYQLSQKYDFDLIVDTQLHPLSNCLKQEQHLYSGWVLYNKDNIEFQNNVESRIQNQHISLLLTNDHFNEPIDDNCREFIKRILRPNDDFFCPIPQEQYSILHFRLGDDEMVRNIATKQYDTYLDKIREKKEDTDIFISDSSALKQRVKQEWGMRMFDGKIGHIGYHSDPESIRYSFFEFLLLTKASKIKTFTTLGWISGFVKTANLIYNVPIEVIQ